jgi:hypothetical protein
MGPQSDRLRLLVAVWDADVPAPLAVGVFVSNVFFMTSRSVTSPSVPRSRGSDAGRWRPARVAITALEIDYGAK